MKTLKHALIAGGGIAGPAVALALAKAGIRSTIFESYPAAADGVGAGLMLAPNGLEALKIIGVHAELRRVSRPIPQLLIADSRGKVLSRFDGLEGMQPSRVVWRPDLYRVLRQAAEHAGIPIVYGKRLAAAGETTGGVDALFTDGSHASGDMLIGADGIRSSVRALIDPAAPSPHYTGSVGLGGIVPHGVMQVPADTMTFVFGRHGFFGYWLDPDRGICWFGNLPHAERPTTAELGRIPAAQWLERLREFYGDDQPAQRLLGHADPDRLLPLVINEMMPPVPRWHSERMVLVGDAVHAPSSSSGQGASLAIESAVQLARCLRDIPEPAYAFARYEQLRRERVEKVAAAAAKTNRQKAAGPLAKALMHVVMPIALKTFFNPARMFGAQHAYRIDWEAFAR